MQKFWELFADSVIVQALLTLIIVGEIVLVRVQGREVTPEMWGLANLIIGFYFGGKVTTQARRLLKKE